MAELIPQRGPGLNRPYEHEHKFERTSGTLEFTSDDGTRHSRVHVTVEMCAHCTAVRQIEGITDDVHIRHLGRQP